LAASEQADSGGDDDRGEYAEHPSMLAQGFR
jgi:hypothetical protein